VAQNINGRFVLTTGVAAAEGLITTERRGRVFILQSPCRGCTTRLCIRARVAEGAAVSYGEIFPSAFFLS
jgi:hypothetical protein